MRHLALFYIIYLSCYKGFLAEKLSDGIELMAYNMQLNSIEDTSSFLYEEFDAKENKLCLEMKNQSNNCKSKRPNKNQYTLLETESKSQQKPKLSDEEFMELEKKLLTVLGFEKRPKVDRSKIIIPEFMKQLYQKIMNQNINSVNLPKPGMHTRNANTVRSFTHEDSDIDNRFVHHNRFRFFFNVSCIPPKDQLRAAELQLTRSALVDDAFNRYQVLVYDIVRPGIKNKREPVLILIDSKSIKSNGNSTLSLDVTPAVKRWITTPKHNFGILVHISSSNKNKTTSLKQQHIRLKRQTTDSTDATWNNYQPILLTYTDDGQSKSRSTREAVSNRNRRAPGRGRNKRPAQKICQRKALYVDFVDVGWSDWIVAPPGYEAYYCEGDCQFPIADHLNTTNHAIVQTLVNSYSPLQVPKACCVPTHLSSICMLYLDDQNKVVLKNYQDMTVVGCGCR